MTVATAERPRFDIGRVLSRTFGVLGRNIVVFLLLAVLLSALPQAALQYLQVQALTGMQGGGRIFANWPFLLFGGLASLVGAYVLQAALIHGTVADLNGRRADFGDCIATGLRYFLPLIAIAILMGIALLFGLILLVVPAVLMALAWCVAVPAEVVERTGVFGAFSRSAELTRGHRGAIFGLGLIWFVLAIVIGMVGQAIAGALTLGSSSDVSRFVVVNAMINVPLQSIFGMAGAAAVASTYYELRSIKEGIGPEALAAVFD